MADTPPPIPSNRPKSQYVPPPIPTNRPKSSYVAPVIGAFMSKPKPKPAANKPMPTPKPRTSLSDEPVSHQNHTHHQNSFNHTAAKADKPQPSAKPSLFTKPSNRSSIWSQSSNSSAKNGQVQVKVDTAGASKAMWSAAMDKETRSKAMTKEQEKDAGKLAWGVTKNAAKNASMDDFMKASKAASDSSSSGKSGSAAFASSMIKSQASKDQPVMTKDQQKQAAKLSWGIGKNLAKNVTMNDMKKAASFVSVSTSSPSSTQQQQQPIPAHRPAPTQPPTARARPKPAGAGASTSALPPPISSQGSVRLQATSQPKPVTRSAFSLKPPTSSDQSRNRLKPTIIRPGASNQKSTSKPNSRSSSPSFDNNNTKKVPPPRPSGGPPQGKKGGPPPRPTSVPSAKQRTSVTGNKPKRPAPKKPSLLEKHGLSSIEITPTPSQVGSAADSAVDLPPRPGPGHPLYKYIVSQPHAIAQYDYDAQADEDLSFKAEDVIILKRKIDADWYIGRCGNKEGMFPSQFVRVVRDVTEDKEKKVSAVGNNNVSGPRCMAKFEYKSDDWDDLTFPEGAVIKLLEKVDNDWLKGEYNGQSGIFPKGYVEIVEDLPAKATSVSPALSLVSSGDLATALYDFNAAEDGELTFKEGDRIKIVGKFNDDWYIGTLNGKQGRFPANFVDKVPADLSSNSEPAIKSVEPHAFVQYDFDAEGNGELSLKAGETVILLEKIGDEWLKGRYRGKEGIFPKSFVEVIVDLPQKKPQARATGVGKAKYEFKAEAEEDLSFREGDTIELIQRINSEWMVGKLNGKTGQFPVNFIEIITPLPS